MPSFARLCHFLIDICIRIVYTCGNYIRRWVHEWPEIKELLLFGAQKAPGRVEGGNYAKNRSRGKAQGLTVINTAPEEAAKGAILP